MEVLFYGVFGFAVTRLLVTVANLWKSPKLPRTSQQHHGNISILIPARNEAHNIGKTIQYLQKQDYQEYELCILDDHSSDNTAGIIQQFAAKDQRIKLLSGKELPKDWLGKNWACHQLAKQANGDYLMFIDADVIVRQGLIQSVLQEVKHHQLSLLSIFPDQQLITWGERITVPIMHYILLTLLPLQLVRRLPQTSLAAANGQFLFFDAADYRAQQFHQTVRKEVTEDIEMVKVAKQKGLKVSTYLGNKLIECRMYQSWSEAVDGFGKNLLAGFGNMFGLGVFLFLTVFAYIPLLLYLPQSLLLLFPIILITNIILAVLSNQSIWQTLLLHPLKMLTLCWVAYLSVYRTIAKTNQWKGRNINIS